MKSEIVINMIVRVASIILMTIGASLHAGWPGVIFVIGLAFFPEGQFKGKE